MSGTYGEDENPINVYAVIAAAWNIGTEMVIMDYSGGSGVIESIQFAETGRNFNAILNVTIDGGTMMSCSEPSFFGFALDPISTTLAYTGTGNYQYNPNIVCGTNNENYIGQCNSQWGCKKRVFIPFTSSIRITVTYPDTTATVNSHVIYRKWPSAFPLYYSIGERRKYWHVVQDGTWGTPVSLSAFQTYNTTQISGRGQIEFISHVLLGVNATGSGCNVLTCLEGEYGLNIDGALQTYGRSDNFWGGNYYWNQGTSGTYGETTAVGPDCGLFTWVGQSWQGSFNLHGYRFFYDKPIFFDQSFQFSWTYGNSSRSVFGSGISNAQNIFIVSYWLESQ